MVLIAAMVAIASVAGIAWPALYALDMSLVRPALVAQDLFNLLVAVPLLLFSSARLKSGDARLALVRLGTLAYLVYSYAVYAFNVHHNPLFLMYTALLALSTYGLVAGVWDLMGDRLAKPGSPRTARWVGGYMVGIGVMFTLVWLIDIGASLGAGHPPAITARYQVPTFAPYVLDLGFALPALIIGGLRLRAERPSGYLVGGLMLIMMVLMMAQLGTGTAYQGYVSGPMDWAFLILFNALAVVSGGVVLAFLKHCIRPGIAAAV